MKRRQYKRIEDPGHSWLEVPIKDVKSAGVLDKITEFSPVKNKKMYLEEDCDMSPFLDALEAKGIVVDILSIRVDDFDEYLAQQN